MPESPESSWKRLARALALVFVVAITAYSGRSIDLSESKPGQTILMLHAVPDGSAIVAWRDERTEHDWVSRYDATGERWRARVPGSMRNVGFDAAGMDVREDSIAIQYVDPTLGACAATVIELEDGHTRWAMLVESPSGGCGVLSARMALGGERLLLSTDEDWLEIDARTGRILERFPSSKLPEIADGELSAEVPRRSGDTYSTWCAVDDGRVVWNAVASDKGVAASLRFETTSPHEVPLDFVDYIVGCAEYGDAIVLFGVRDVHVVGADGRTRRSIKVPPRAHFWNRSDNPYAGRLPRFLLVPARISWKPTRNTQNVVVDLEANFATIEDVDADGETVYRDGSRWIRQWRKWSRWTIEIRDGRTNAVLDEVALPWDVYAHQIAGGFVWVCDRDEDLHHLSFARIDLATLRTDIAYGGIRIGYSRAK